MRRQEISTRSSRSSYRRSSTSASAHCTGSLRRRRLSIRARNSKGRPPMNIEICEALRIDERGEVDWTRLIDVSGLPEAELRELVDDGALGPVDRTASSWSFDAHALVLARTAGRLHRELDLDA